MSFSIVGHRTIWFWFSGILSVISVLALTFWGLRFGIDFTGGSLTELSFTRSVAVAEIASALTDEGFGEVLVQPTQEMGYLIRSVSLTEDEHTRLLSVLRERYGEVSELRFDSIGPVIGRELRTNAAWAVSITLVLIGLYIAVAFRKVSEPIASWKYGLITILTAFHDVVIPLGVFSILGHFLGWEVSSTFIAAALTILGYSINDTVVVFDRTRENLSKHLYDRFEDTVEASIRQTALRSFNTSLTTLLALAAIFFLGGESTRSFALALFVGIAIGTYSSIFVASNVFVTWEKFGLRKGRA